MKSALGKMIVTVPLIIGFGLTGCTVMTKQEHIEMHREIHQEMLTSEAHKVMMQKMMKEMMPKMMDVEETGHVAAEAAPVI